MVEKLLEIRSVERADMLLMSDMVVSPTLGVRTSELSSVIRT